MIAVIRSRRREWTNEQFGQAVRDELAPLGSAGKDLAAPFERLLKTLEVEESSLGEARKLGLTIMERIKRGE